MVAPQVPSGPVELPLHRIARHLPERSDDGEGDPERGEREHAGLGRAGRAGSHAAPCRARSSRSTGTAQARIATSSAIQLEQAIRPAAKLAAGRQAVRFQSTRRQIETGVSPFALGARDSSTRWPSTHRAEPGPCPPNLETTIWRCGKRGSLRSVDVDLAEMRTHPRGPPHGIRLRLPSACHPLQRAVARCRRFAANSVHRRR